MKIRPIVSPSGKTRYQAQLWYDNEFYKSKMFDQEHLAELWHETTLIKAIKGLILPACDRPKQLEQEQAQREREAALALPLTHFAQRYTEKGLHGKKRNNEYTLVAQHFGSKPLRAFSGKNGAALIAQATKDLYWMRQRGVGSLEPDAQGDSAPAKPLTHSTVQKRLTALIRLIGFAASELPEGTEFTVPDMAAHKKYGGWTLPPAHANPRQRLASNHELAAVLHAADPASDLGQLLQAQDETGCRLGELLHAGGAQVTAFFDASGQLFGGKLHLPTHKTYCKTGKARDVPLSRRAAAILLARKEVCGDGPLFPSLGSTKVAPSESRRGRRSFLPLLARRF